jgi:hypothetical protein
MEKEWGGYGNKDVSMESAPVKDSGPHIPFPKELRAS